MCVCVNICTCMCLWLCVHKCAHVFSIIFPHLIPGQNEPFEPTRVRSGEETRLSRCDTLGGEAACSLGRHIDCWQVRNKHAVSQTPNRGAADSRQGATVGNICFTESSRSLPPSFNHVHVFFSSRRTRPSLHLKHLNSFQKGFCQRYFLIFYAMSLRYLPK